MPAFGPAIIAAAGSFAVAGLLAAVPAAGVPAASPVPGARSGQPASATAPVISISPDMRRVVSIPAAAPPTTAVCETDYKIACYEPAQIRQAYGLPDLASAGIEGQGQTIVIVDSFGSPTVRHDLAVFDRAEHLPAPPSLRIIRPAGKIPPYRPDAVREGWAGETDLDVEYAHAIAPAARILLVETPTAENEGRTGFPQIVKAEKYVIDHHLGGVISQSFSATEQTFASPRRLLSLRGAYLDAARKGVTVLAASGDSGAADVRYNGSAYYRSPVTSWPDSDPLVTGVGAVQLRLSAAGSQIAPARAWNDTYDLAVNEYLFGGKGPNPLASGGGRSVIFTRPWYQRQVGNVVLGRRGVPDISMSGACDGAVDMYQSFRGEPAGWYPTCGTSVSTPEFAGIVALADQVAGRRLGLINPYLYVMSANHAPGIVDITAGNNTVSFRQGNSPRLRTVQGFTARVGYDLATGVGTVRAPQFVHELACLATHPGRRLTSSRIRSCLR